MKVNQGVLLSQPKDKSLEAFKAWMQEMTKHLTGREKTDGTITEEEWIQYHKNFWAKNSED
jgi:sulfur relay (sulfurtransferase) DsrC/TusE family protein